MSPRPEGIPAWSSLSERDRRINARLMEVYAASLAYADHQIGRVIDDIRTSGAYDNTLILFIQGDNGGSSEGTLRGTLNEASGIAGLEEAPAYMESMLGEMGGPTTFEHYPAGWAWAMNAPFPWVKQIASHLGATRAGFVASWPKRIVPDARPRQQFTHVVDIFPTILEAADLPVPRRVNGTDQQPLGGVSFAYSFFDAAAPNRHKVQYFELMGNRGIYADGWFASSKPRRVPWKLAGRPPGDVIDDYEWELYDLRRDFAQSRNLATQQPHKLVELKKLFDGEAVANGVYPIDDSFVDRYSISGAPPSVHGDRKRFSYPSDMPRVPVSVAPPIAYHDFSVSTRVLDGAGPNANGVISAVGGRFGGWSFYILDGRPVIAHALSQQSQHKMKLIANRQLPLKSNVDLRFYVDYERDRAGGPARVTILIDGEPAGTKIFPRTSAMIGGAGNESLDFGMDSGTPATEDYRSPFQFSGKMEVIEYKLENFTGGWIR